MTEVDIEDHGDELLDDQLVEVRPTEGRADTHRGSAPFVVAVDTGHVPGLIPPPTELLIGGTQRGAGGSPQRLGHERHERHDHIARVGVVGSPARDAHTHVSARILAGTSRTLARIPSSSSEDTTIRRSGPWAIVDEDVARVTHAPSIAPVPRSVHLCVGSRRIAVVAERGERVP